MNFSFASQGPCQDPAHAEHNVMQWWTLDNPESFGMWREGQTFHACIMVPRAMSKWFQMQTFTVEQLIWICGQNGHELSFLFTNH